MTVLEKQLLENLGQTLTTAEEYEAAILRLDPSVNGLDKMTAVILLASAIRGPGADRLAKFLGYKRFIVRAVGKKLRDRGTWKDGESSVPVFDSPAFWKEVRAVRYRVPPTPKTPAKIRPFTLVQMKALHDDINEYRQDSPGRYRVWSQKRRLTTSEWGRIGASIKKHRLAVVMRTSAFCFKLGVDIIKPPGYPGLPVTPVMAIAQKSVPEELAHKDKLKQGDKKWNPRDEWNATWDLLSKWAFTDENMELVKFCGIKMAVHKRDYEY
jgi:hypothetical protein